VIRFGQGQAYAPVSWFRGIEYTCIFEPNSNPDEPFRVTDIGLSIALRDFEADDSTGAGSTFTYDQTVDHRRLQAAATENGFKTFDLDAESVQRLNTDGRLTVPATTIYDLGCSFQRGGHLAIHLRVVTEGNRQDGKIVCGINHRINILGRLPLENEMSRAQTGQADSAGVP